MNCFLLDDVFKIKSLQISLNDVRISMPFGKIKWKSNSKA